MVMKVFMTLYVTSMPIVAPTVVRMIEALKLGLEDMSAKGGRQLARLCRLSGGIEACHNIVMCAQYERGMRFRISNRGHPAKVVAEHKITFLQTMEETKV